MNLLLKVRQIKDISMFDGILRQIYNDKTAVNRCSFGESRKKHDFKPFFGVWGIKM